MFNFKDRVYISVAIIVTAVVVVASVYWNEARKEVVFLCSNFGKGVSQSSVLRQLSTGNLLRYQIQRNATGSHITVDSMLNLGRYKCIIEFDSDDKVMHAEAY